MPAFRRSSAFQAYLPFFAAGLFLVIQLFLLPSYGISWDEPLHRTWAQMILSGETGELPGHGDAYGPLFYLASYGVTQMLVATGVPIIPAMHVLTVLTAALGLLLTFFLARMVWGVKTAWGSLLFLALFPVFIAHSQYNPKDIPLLTAAVLVMFAAYRARAIPSYWSWMILGAACGFALSIKLSAVLIFPAAGILLIPHLLDRSVTPAKKVIVIKTAFFSLAVILFLTWPTAWTDPSVIIRAFRFFLQGDFWSGDVLYFGTVSSASLLPWHYTIFYYLAVIPLVTLVCAMIGAVRAILDITAGRQRWEWCALFVWLLLPLCIGLLPGVARYDGMRQFLFTVPALMIFAGAGLQWVITKRPAMRYGIIALAIILLAIDILRFHPYEGSYKNNIALLFLSSSAEHQFDIEDWGTSEREGIAWLNQYAKKDASVCAPIAPLLLDFYNVRPDLRVGCEKGIDYVMLFSRYGMIPEEARTPDGAVVFRITRAGSDLLKIYDTTVSR